ncbi:MAG: DUF2474 family protein [Pseudomonadota bacterium]
MTDPAATPRRTRQWLWFIGLWAAGVVAVGVVAILLRLVFRVILA